MSYMNKSGKASSTVSNTDSGAHKFNQRLVSQNPVYDRVLKVHRPNKRKLKPKWV
jgi:hypothetical protein